MPPLLPPVLRDYAPSEKLLWLHVKENPGELDIVKVAEELGVQSNNLNRATKRLREAGLLINTGERTPRKGNTGQPGRGWTFRSYRVAEGSELERAKPLQVPEKALREEQPKRTDWKRGRSGRLPEQRAALLRDWDAGERNRRELSRKHQVGYPTVRKWIEQHEQERSQEGHQA